MSAVLEYEVFERDASPVFRPVHAPMRAPSPAPGADNRRDRAIHALLSLSDDSDNFNRLDVPLALVRLGKFFTYLPTYMPQIQPYISYAGSISFDWDEDSKNSLSLMLQPDGRLGFAAYFSGDRSSGAIDLNHESFSREVAPIVNRWAVRAKRLVL